MPSISSLPVKAMLAAAGGVFIAGLVFYAIRNSTIPGLSQSRQGFTG